MSSMLRRDLFVLRHCLRRRSHLSDPVINDIRDLALPREAVYHFMDPSGMISGPRVSDPMMQKVEGIRYVDHLTAYHKPDITPVRKLGTNITTMITEYRSKNRSFRRMLDPVKNATDPKALLIYNYSMISAAYTFPRSLRAPWYEFRAQMNTLIKNINDTAKLTNRSHYFILDLPDELPALPDLINGVRNFNNTTLRTIPTFEDKFIFEMFKWLGRGNKDSILSDIDKKHYPKINFIFKRLDKWIVINLEWISNLSQNFNSRAIFDARRMETAFIKLLSDTHLAGRPFNIEIKEVDDSKGDLEDEDPGDGETVVEDDVKADSNEITEKERKELESLDINALLSFKDESGPSVIYSEEELDQIESELLEAASKMENVEIIELDDEELDSLMEDLTDAPSINTDILSEITGFEPNVNASVALAGELNSKGVISNNEYNRIVRISEKFETIPDPYDPKKMLADTVSEQDISELEIDELESLDEKILLDKSLGRAKVDQFENEYREKFLKKDILESISAIQKGPISITDYTVETVENSQNKHEVHTIKVTPVVGKPTTIRQMLPVVEDDGTFKYNGTSYRMKMQRVDMPIRKISDTQVALNSYYGKLFVELSTRSVNNYTGRFVNWIKSKLIDPNDKDFTDGYIKASESNDPRLPLIYGSISSEVERFKITETKTDVCFNFGKRFELLKLDKEIVTPLEGKNYTVFAKGRGSLYFLDKNGSVFEYRDSDLIELGSLESFLGMDQSTLPTPQVGMKIYSKTIPIGVSLAYLIGFENLLKLLKIKVRRVNMGERPVLTNSEYAIKFRNQTLVLDRTNVLHTMVMSGFNEYAKYIKDYDVGMFDSKDVYSAIMDRAGIGNRYMRKLSSTSIYFIDPITEKILKMMKEPTEFIDLILRACSMLVTSYTPKEVDGGRTSAKGLTRLRGYDRIAGFAYENIVKAIEQQNMSPNAGRTGVAMNPWDTMNIIRSDPTVAPVDSLNPIQYLREREIVTHTGRGGRNKRSMVGRTRIFTDQDTGVISEATVDSGDVGVIVYASQDSDIKSVYGTTGESKLGESLEAGRLLSSAALLSPNADGDDPKRIAFISVQHGHGIQAKGYEVQPLRTGNERTLVSRMNDTFAQTADDDGTVTELTKDYVAVKYKSGNVKKYKIGKKIITSTGSKYPNEIITTATKVGYKYKKGDVISYNKGFFSPSPLEKNKVDYMSGCLAKTALREASYTLEDSCAISEELAERLVTISAEPHYIRMSFDQEIGNLVKVGDKIELGDPICLIEDSVSSGAGLFDDETRASLSLLSSMSPTSKATGVVSDIEIHYRGDIDFMSPSLAKLTKSLESSRKKLAKDMDKNFIPNMVEDNVRIGGHEIGTDEVILIIHVDHEVPAGIGDKLVFGNQGKSTIGEVLAGNTRTISGEKIDAIFGAKSFIDRIITSPFKNGLCNSYLMAVGDVACEMWLDDKK